jgi:predicted phage-related endonuclease
MTITKAILQQRRQGVGGSDAGGIIGVSPWSTPLSVYDSKTLDLPPEPEKDVYWFGNHGEKLVAARIWHDLKKAKRSRGHKLVEPKSMIWHVNGWAFGNPDRLLIDKKNGHQREGYECKWVSRFQSHLWPEDGDTANLPLYVFAQAFHYLWVLRNAGLDGPPLERWWVVACLEGFDVRYYEISWSERVAAAHEKALRRFWFDHVVPRVPPPHTHREQDGRALNRRFSHEVEEVIEASQSTEERLERCRQIKAQIDSLHEERSLLRNDLRVVMGTATRLKGSAANVSYKRPRTREKVDYKGLVGSLDVSPKEISKFTTKQSQERRLTITIKGE